MGITDTAFSKNQGLLFNILDKHYRTVIEVFGLRLLKEFRKQEEQFEAIYRDFASANTGSKIVGIQAVTRKHIAKIVTMGVTENLGVAQLANEIRAEGRGRFTKYRSATIARTETHNAASFANQQVAQSMNLPNQRKRWMTTQDERSRDSHRAMNGKTVALDEDFIVNGMSMSYPGDPKGGASNVINCRCVLIYVNDEDEIEG